MENTALYAAIHLNDDIDIAELLISKGVEVNAKNSFAKTPLHEAVMGDLEHGGFSGFVGGRVSSQLHATELMLRL